MQVKTVLPVSRLCWWETSQTTKKQNQKTLQEAPKTKKPKQYQGPICNNMSTEKPAEQLILHKPKAFVAKKGIVSVGMN